MSEKREIELGYGAIAILALILGALWSIGSTLSHISQILDKLVKP